MGLGGLKFEVGERTAYSESENSGWLKKES